MFDYLYFWLICSWEFENTLLRATYTYVVCLNLRLFCLTARDRVVINCFSCPPPPQISRSVLKGEIYEGKPDQTLITSYYVHIIHLVAVLLCSGPINVFCDKYPKLDQIHRTPFLYYSAINLFQRTKVGRVLKGNLKHFP